MFSKRLNSRRLIDQPRLDDGRDLTSAILARWIAALVDDRAQLLCPGSGCFERPDRSRELEGRGRSHIGY
jgi:hypothetical protein